MKRGNSAVQMMRDALSESRRGRPRDWLPRPIESYIDHKILNRPLLAPIGLARVAEYLLAKHGELKCVTDLYDSVCLAIGDILALCDSGALRRKDLEVIRRVGEDLLERTRSVLRRLETPCGKPEWEAGSDGTRSCPFCHGKGMTSGQVRLFKYALLKMIEIGVLPESFKIFA